MVLVVKMYLDQLSKIERIKRSESRDSILIDLVKSQMIILKKNTSVKNSLYKSLIRSLRDAKNTKHIAYLYSENIIRNSITHGVI